MNKTADKIAEINGWIQAGNLTLPALFGLAHLIAGLVKHGDAVTTFEQDVDRIHEGGAAMVTKADAWFAAHPQYDPMTGTRRDA